MYRPSKHSCTQLTYLNECRGADMHKRCLIRSIDASWRWVRKKWHREVKCGKKFVCCWSIGSGTSQYKKAAFLLINSFHLSDSPATTCYYAPSTDVIDFVLLYSPKKALTIPFGDQLQFSGFLNKFALSWINLARKRRRKRRIFKELSFA